MGWQKLKELIQSIQPADFEKLVARLLELHLEEPFVVARSGDQPRGDARSIPGDVSIQAKHYTSENTPNAKVVEGDIREAIRSSSALQVYVLAVSRDAEQLNSTEVRDFWLSEPLELPPGGNLILIVDRRL